MFMIGITELIILFVIGSFFVGAILAVIALSKRKH